MKPYSEDLRQRVADAVDQREGSLRQIAQRFAVSLSFITRLLRRRRQTGSLAPKPHGGGQPPAFDAAGLKHLEQLLQEQPDATLAELQQRSGVPCSPMAVWRALRKLKITRKKKTLRANERDSQRVQEKRQAYQQMVAGQDPECLVFVDESGATTAMTRTHGRAPRGQRVYGAVPGSWRSVTLISAVRLGGVVASFAFPGATDTAAFRTYVERLLAPRLRPGDVVVWDNLRPHQDAEVVRAVEATGARVAPAPPWSPDLLPIEKMWSKVKGSLRAAGARCTETLYQAMGRALDQVRPQDIRGWFESCGLCATQA